MEVIDTVFCCWEIFFAFLFLVLSFSPLAFFFFSEGEDVMTKSSLARVRWQVTLVEHEPTKSPGWKLVDDMRKLSDEVHEVELLLESRELQKADFEDFSKQEDKLKVSCSEFSSGTKVERLFGETTPLILSSGRF